MKLVTFLPDTSELPDLTRPRLDAATLGESRVGLLIDERVYDLASGFRMAGLAFEPRSLQALLEAPEACSALGQVREACLRGVPEDAVWELTKVHLLAPLPRPRTLRDCLAYERHLRQCTRTVLRRTFRPLAALDRICEKLWGGSLVPIPRVWYQQPVYYKGNPDTVVGPGHEICWPSYTRWLDFELELALVIGQAGRNIPVEQAAGHIAGYTIFNDFSARDVQLREMKGRLGPAKGKDFDTSNVLGPCFVTRDEIGTEPRLKTQVVVNDEVWSESSTADLQFSVAEIVSWISQDETVHPGDVIGLGTVPYGCGLELDRWIQPGDRVELSIEKIGTLANVIEV